MPSEGDPRLGLSHLVRVSHDASAPVVFFVHGRAGNKKVMWIFRRCIPDSFTIIAPQAPFADELGGFSWWDVSKSGREGRDAAQRAKETLVGFIEGAVNHYGYTGNVKVAIGFSQGAGLLSLLAQESPHIFKGVALLSGFVICSEESRAASQAELPRVLVVHGTKDEVVPVDKARQGIEYLRTAGFEVEAHEDAVGHKVGASGMVALKAWVNSFNLRTFTK